MKILTKAEEEVMQILWDMKSGFVKDIITRMPEPKPAYNTVSTIIRILESKKFVGHEAFGKSYQYYPLIAKEDYSNQYIKRFISKYFSGSFENMVSFFAAENNIPVGQLDEIIKRIKDKNND